MTDGTLAGGSTGRSWPDRGFSGDRGLRTASLVATGLALVGSVVMVNVPVSATNSGVIAVYGSDFISVTALIVVVACGIRRGWQRPRFKHYVIVVTVFLVLCAVVSGVRTIGGASDLQSLLIPRANLASVWVVLAVLWLEIPAQRFLLMISGFSWLLAVVSFGIAAFAPQYNLLLWQSNSIRTILLALLMPANVLAVCVFATHKRWRVITIVSLGCHLIAVLFCGVITGSRLNSILIPAAAVVCIAVVSRSVKRAGTLFLVACVPFTLFALYGAQGCSPAIKYGIQRTPAVGLFLDKQGPGSLFCAEGDGPPTASQTFDSPGDSKEESSRVRFEVWRLALADIQANPVFGPGYRQYEVRLEVVDDRAVVLSPHNVFLEYSLAYGLVGVGLWAVMFGWPLRRTLSPQGWREARGRSILLLSFLGTAFAIGMVQPIFSNPVVLLIAYTVVASFAGSEGAISGSGKAVPGLPERSVKGGSVMGPGS